jgi:arginase family enzyme
MVNTLQDAEAEWVPGDNSHSLLNARNCKSVGNTCQKLYKLIKPAAKEDNFLLIIGGDHCIPMGTVPAIVEERPNTGKPYRSLIGQQA